MPEVVFKEHPHMYRALLRLLPLGVVLTVASFGIGAWALVSAINHNQNVTQQLRAQSAQLRAQNIRQERTIKSLCDDLYIIDGIVETVIDAARMRLRDHLARGLTKAATIDQYALRSYESYHRQLLDQVTSKDSPCVS